ncbi:uncharacterized protein METZ01_LOCUS34978 [marine metagenome]|mgnify:FL=1|uniref:DUF1552 domain-containing protein n=1 Tax=marine metagenome TaxID=408172 RepID=A0A381QT32_9ZZZZ
MYITKKHLSRRTVLHGMGVTLGVPLLDAMFPAGRLWAGTSAAGAANRTRLVCIEQVHGAAGCNKWGASQYLWAPEMEGSDFDLSPSSLQPLEPFRDHLTIISNTDSKMAEAFVPEEIGGDHYRSSAVFLTQARPRLTEGSDVRVGTSMDQLYVQRIGQETPIPSLQLSIEPVDQSGGCAYGYACVYTDTVSWASPTEPLPMVRDPRALFEMLFGAGGTPEQRSTNRQTDRSILDWVTGKMANLRRQLGPIDRQRLDQYVENIREIEQRIQRIEERNSSGDTRDLPEAPAGVPDSFEEHVKLMFDLQLLAFESDLTRVFSFKWGRDASGRVYPESGSDSGFHGASHHGGREERVKEFAKINKYHVSMLPYFLEKLQNTMDGDTTLLDETLIIYGSPMADSNLHNHRRCPLILLGGAGGQLDGGLHIHAKDDTPMANVMLSLMHRLGMDDLESFGDSNGEFSFAAPNTKTVLP